MNVEQPIRPLKDVWLRPRRVFRELANQPIGAMDYVLAAAQGVGTSFLSNQFQPAATRLNGGDLVSAALLFGPIGGVVSIWLSSLIYSRMFARMARPVSRPQVFHVLAYGAVPLICGIVLWAATVLLVGDGGAANPSLHEEDGFVWTLSHAQKLVSLVLILWSVLLQAMGLSELSEMGVRKSFGVWVLGQLILGVAALLLMGLLQSLISTGSA